MAGSLSQDLLWLDEERLLPRIQVAGCFRFLVVRLCLLADDWQDSAARQRRRHHETTMVDDAMHGLNLLQDARSDTHCSRLQESLRSAMSEATQDFVRRVAQIHLHSGKDSYLHPEAALRSCSVTVQ